MSFGDIQSAISGAIEDALRFPFLFIGSGLSKRYMDTPSWEPLLQQICEDVVGDLFAFSRYQISASSQPKREPAQSVLPKVASLMEPDVNDALLRGEPFRWFREKHRQQILSGASPLKLYVADVFSSCELRGNEGEVGLLRRAARDKVSGVITTNYDTMCEQLFEGYTTYVGEGDLLFADPSYSQEIYKIHGSVADPDSLVLTAADYDAFKSRRKYLSAKLLTIFVEYPVVFLGYSLQDENIQGILSDVCECLAEDKLERFAKRLIFVTRPHGGQTRVSRYVRDFSGKTVEMTSIETDDFASVYRALLSARKLYSTKFVKEMRGSIYRLAQRIDPASDIVVSGVDNVLSAFPPDQKVAVGVALSPSAVGKPITPEDIFEDVVLDNLRFDPKFIVENYLNTFIRRYPNLMPVFKYTSALDRELWGDRITSQVARIASLDSFRSRTIRQNMPSFRKRNAHALGVRSLQDAVSQERLFHFVPYLERDEIDLKELESCLKSALTEYPKGSLERNALLKDSAFRKCVRIYDYLRYGCEE